MIRSPEPKELPARCLAQVSCRITHTWAQLSQLLANLSWCCRHNLADIIATNLSWCQHLRLADFSYATGYHYMLHRALTLRGITI